MIYSDKEQKKAEKKIRVLEKQAEIDRNDFIREAMKLRQGREYIYWLLSITNLHANPFTGNALMTSFRCGELNIGQQIREHVIAMAPTEFLTMLQEKENDRTSSPDFDYGTSEGNDTD